MAVPFRQIRTPYGGDVTVAGRNATPEAAAALIQSQVQPFEDSANAPIPGLFNGRPITPGQSTAPYQGMVNGMAGSVLSQWMNNNMTPEQWRGLLVGGPQQAQLSPPDQFQPAGPYGQQAMMMAGLLGRSQIPQQPGMPQAQGLLANPSYTRMMGRIYGK